MCGRLALACDSGKDSLNSLSADLIEKGATVNLLEFSLGSEENIKDVVNATIGQYDTLDGLVFALEEPFHGSIEDIEDPTKVVEAVLDANYYTLVYFTYHALAHLRKSRGRIILLSSYNEEGQDSTDALYYASRGATVGEYLLIMDEYSLLTLVSVV